ncbi:MAG: N-acetylmuramoyl-L-alanine amidase family protein [Thermoanaerobaculia bacterium]
MRAATIDRVKRRVLEQAVAENLDTIRGLPPRGLRRRARLTRLWIRRAGFVLLPLSLAGSSYLVSKPTASQDVVPQLAARSPQLTAPAPRIARASLTPTIDSLQRFDSAALPLSVRRVVLDAGHGGKDAGATTTAALTEKEITLDVVSRLKSLLVQAGFEVVITRTDDRFLALRDRARVANESSSDIFVSVHVNSIVDHTSSHGIETYYLGPTNDPELTRLAASENQASGYSLADMRKLLDGIYADARRDESRRLAAAVQSQLFTGLRQNDKGLENWGVKRAPFVVLVATEMPAVLAEVGCMSNNREVEMLHKPEYRQEIAQALFRGIHAYATGNEKKGT